MPKSAQHSAFSKAYALGSLFFDKRMPSAAKWLLAASLLYTVIPIDIVPDFVLGVGWLDDIAALIAAATYFWQKAKPFMPPR